MKIYITNNSLYLVGPIQEVLQKITHHERTRPFIKGKT